MILLMLVIQIEDSFVQSVLKNTRTWKSQEFITAIVGEEVFDLSICSSDFLFKILVKYKKKDLQSCFQRNVLRINRFSFRKQLKKNISERNWMNEPRKR